MTKIQLYNDDCLKVLLKLKANSIDLVITSPPYNLGVNYNDYHDKLPESQYIQWLYQVMQQVHRVLKKDGSVFLNLPANRSGTTFKLMALLQHKLFALQNQIVWVKSISVGNNSYGHFKPVNSPRYLHSGYEFLFHLTKKGDVAINRLAVGVAYQDKSNIARFKHIGDRRCRGNVWFIPYRTRNQKLAHPTSFPVKLPHWCIKLANRVNAVVLDPFCGSGSVAIAAIKQHCGKFIGIDLDKSYIKLTAKRCQRVSNGT